MVAKRLLVVAAAGNFAVALLHFVLAFAGEAANRYFGAPPGVLQMYRQERPRFILLVLGMAALFGLIGLYNASGAGLLRRFPLLRSVLVATGLVYTLRGLELPVDIVVAMARPEFSRQFIVFSACSLAIGLASLAGTFGQWRSLGPVQRSRPAGQ